MLSDADIAARVRSEDGRKGYAAGLAMAASMLDKRVSEHRWTFWWSLKQEMRRLAFSWRTSAEIIDEPSAPEQTGGSE